MIYLELFISFFKIGLFSFGGGYAMIPLISDEIITHGWLLESEFIKILGIAEMTPGPIAVNSATFVGYSTAGVLGAACATLGVAMPSILIILLISGFFFKHNQHPLVKSVFKYIRPIVAGLIFVSVLTIGRATLILKDHGTGDKGIRFETVFIMIILLFIYLKKKPHPILLIGFAGGLGALTMLL